MKVAEAIAECEFWWAYLGRQKERSEVMQRLARLARTGPEGQAEAQKLLRKMDSESAVVYDGAKLYEATLCLVRLARSTAPERDSGTREAK
ncbi:MAG: hypothetical protein HC794_00790 [Nitrospiraceae bacterium]|nr:hypothetical protein [Nitrospiraceae bacterium]